MIPHLSPSSVPLSVGPESHVISLVTSALASSGSALCRSLRQEPAPSHLCIASAWHRAWHVVGVQEKFVKQMKCGELDKSPHSEQLVGLAGLGHMS